MGLSNHYRSVSNSDEAVPLSEKPGKLRSGWGKQSILLSLATGVLFIAIIAAVLSTIGSAVVSYTSKDDSSSTASAAAIIATSTPAPLADESTEDEVALTDEIDHCGYSPDEARERGCIFDVMMQLWTPAACFDSPLSERFLEVGNWTWYANPDASRAYTLEEMRLGEHDAVYVAQDYHITHCIYAWERLVRAMRNQQPLITELISYDHVIHCRHKTLQRADGGAYIRGVRAPTGYTQCAPYDTWKYNLPPNEHSSTEK